ncbi:hypothetical protein FNV43_RR10280 [Rhamnella rubrinervis]|uniref:Uncharacterized protein n=1 Tax=Rhamnella rubrinervis TaxID=2594499 RepID=A0A8K0HBH9_9ROSA|nr:hypothetical protein FNV43_RR10280 [Rhamnella rubrinervis]
MGSPPDRSSSWILAASETVGTSWLCASTHWSWRREVAGGSRCGLLRRRMDSVGSVYDLGFGKSQVGKQLTLGGFKSLIGKSGIEIQNEKIKTNTAFVGETTIVKNGSTAGLGVHLHTNGGSLKKASFAEVVGGASHSLAPLIIADSHSSLPVRKGNLVSIRVNDTAYKERVALCQFSLIARIVLSKGEKPWKLDDLHTKLQNIWKLDK